MALKADIEVQGIPVAGAYVRVMNCSPTQHDEEAGKIWQMNYGVSVWLNEAARTAGLKPLKAVSNIDRFQIKDYDTVAAEAFGLAYADLVTQLQAQGATNIQTDVTGSWVAV